MLSLEKASEGRQENELTVFSWIPFLLVEGNWTSRLSSHWSSWNTWKIQHSDFTLFLLNSLENQNIKRGKINHHTNQSRLLRKILKKVEGPQMNILECACNMRLLFKIWPDQKKMGGICCKGQNFLQFLNVCPVANEIGYLSSEVIVTYPPKNI